jgi:hypothetical protein
LPLKKGKGQTTIKENIAKLVREGFSREQAALIANEHAEQSGTRRARKKKGRKG